MPGYSGSGHYRRDHSLEYSVHQSSSYSGYQPGYTAHNYQYDRQSKLHNDHKTDYLSEYKQTFSNDFKSDYKPDYIKSSHYKSEWSKPAYQSKHQPSHKPSHKPYKASSYKSDTPKYQLDPFELTYQARERASGDYLADMQSREFGSHVDLIQQLQLRSQHSVESSTGGLGHSLQLQLSSPEFQPPHTGDSQHRLPSRESRHLDSQGSHPSHTGGDRQYFSLDRRQPAQGRESQSHRAVAHNFLVDSLNLTGVDSHQLAVCADPRLPGVSGLHLPGLDSHPLIDDSLYLEDQSLVELERQLASLEGGEGRAGRDTSLAVPTPGSARVSFLSPCIESTVQLPCQFSSYASSPTSPFSDPFPLFPGTGLDSGQAAELALSQPAAPSSPQRKPSNPPPAFLLQPVPQPTSLLAPPAPTTTSAALSAPAGGAAKSEGVAAGEDETLKLLKRCYLEALLAQSCGKTRPSPAPAPAPAPVLPVVDYKELYESCQQENNKLAEDIVVVRGQLGRVSHQLELAAQAGATLNPGREHKLDKKQMERKLMEIRNELKVGAGW